jgi:hypothetical protein
MYNGAWRPIGSATQFTTGAEDNMPSYIHQTTDGSDFLITYDTDTGYLKYKPLTSGAYTNLQSIGTGKTVRFSSLHNVLLSFNETDEAIYYTLYDLTEADYAHIGEIRLPDILHLNFHDDESLGQVGETQTLLAADYPVADDMNTAIKGKLAILMSEAWNNGLFVGYTAIMYAYELFDGSIVRHSHFQIVNTGQAQWKGIISPESFQVKLLASAMEYDIVTADADIDNIRVLYKNIIKSVNIYMTRPVNPYIPDVNDPPGTADFEEMPLKDQFDMMQEVIDVSTFRLVRKININELVEGVDNTLTIKNLTTIDTWEPLPVDNFSHHKLYAQNDFKYNNRIFHGDIKMILYKGFNPNIFVWEGISTASGDNYKIWFEVDIKDVDGIKTVRSDEYEINFRALTYIDFAVKEYLYPDSRATTLKIYCSPDEDAVHLVGERNLSAHNIMNMAYYIPLEDIVRVIPESSWGAGTLQAYSYSELPELNSVILNPNRVQASEVDNPFYFPAKNSYNIGSSKVVGMGANTLLIESGQFGEYPIYVFTQDGVWAMNFSADASILIDTIKPAVMDVCTNRDSITSTPYGVVFVTEDMLMLLSGMRSTKISSELEGNYKSPLVNNIGYNQIISNPYIADVESYVDEVNFQSYLQDSIINYNYKKQEIFISNVNYSYSYIYNVLQKMWYKTGSSYNQILSYNQKIIGETGGILFDLTEETWGGQSVPTFIETYPIKLNIDTYNKIEALALRSMLDCDQEAGAGIYLVASTDGIKWFHILSREMVGQLRDIVSKRAPYSACQFIICFSGTLKETSYLTHFDLQYNDKFANKIR